MKIIILLLLLCGSANAEVVREISGLITKDNVNSRVGINLASGADPTVTLDVNGTGIFSNTGASSLDIGGGLNAGTGNVAIIDATGKIPALSSTYLDNLSGANLTALTAANVSAGSLGASVIASSITLAAMYGSPTFSTLTVTGNAFSVGTSTLVVTSGNIGIGIASPTGILHISTGTGATNLIVEDAGTGAGNVGIGTVLPVEKLHLFQNGAYQPKITLQGVPGTANASPSIDFSFDATATRRSHIGAYAVGTLGTDLRIFVKPDSASAVTERMRILENGNVGIGNTAPSDILHISSGTIRMAGTNAPTTGGALCLNATGQMAKCTSAVDASGNCTCP